MNLFSLSLFAALFQLLTSAVDAAPRFSVTKTNYHGWPDSLVLGNGKVEAVIVPAIGRVMQFRFAGRSEGPFWENRALDGKAPDARSTEWGNFGGDKSWPAPQADWPKITGRGWPPPPAFDAMPLRSSILDLEKILLSSPVDPFFGIRVRRLVELDPEKPVMMIRTTYEKVEGGPQKIGVWVITQLKDPVAVFAPIPKNSLFPEGYNRQSEEKLPLDLKVQPGLLSLRRDPKSSTKIGTDAGSLFWVGENEILQIDSSRAPNEEYPDQGSSAEIYTNPDPLPYIELELLGPLSTMKVGDKIERTSTYTLMLRSDPDPAQEMRKLRP